jgi:EAL domain-containing protein (putative c-di-GMP-specific phosphodiesterase class I)
MKDLTMTQAFAQLKKIAPKDAHISVDLSIDRFSSGEVHKSVRIYIKDYGFTDHRDTWRGALEDAERLLHSQKEDSNV